MQTGVMCLQPSSLTSISNGEYVDNMAAVTISPFIFVLKSSDKFGRFGPRNLIDVLVVRAEWLGFGGRD